MSIFHECMLIWKLDNIYTSKTKQNKKTIVYLDISVYRHLINLGHWFGNTHCFVFCVQNFKTESDSTCYTVEVSPVLGEMTLDNFII